MWAASAVVFLHFVGKKPNEEKVNKVTCKLLTKPELSLLLLLFFKN